MPLDRETLHDTLLAVMGRLMALRLADGHWEGELSSSALATATASTALTLVDRDAHQAMIRRGLDWLATHQNADGGWGDTVLSKSNISTTALCWAAFGAQKSGTTEDDHPPRITRIREILGFKPSNLSSDPCHPCDPWSNSSSGFLSDAHRAAVARAEAWLAREAGGIDPDAIASAIIRRYGKDRTFSVPILTMCALAGRLGEGRAAWRHVIPLPFELAACPPRWFKWLRLPVVSYALPALIAIGQARCHHSPPRNPLTRLLRAATRRRTLRVLESIQPESGGFLEAVPLTSFVTMSLASIGQARHPVAARGVEFLARTAREDGSWPIDANLAVWVTTLAVNALAAGGIEDLAERLPEADRARLLDWILAQQLTREHPYTHAAPGGWAWTNLAGGVPDGDDTPGALLAIRNLMRAACRVPRDSEDDAPWEGEAPAEPSSLQPCGSAGASPSQDAPGQASPGTQRPPPVPPEGSTPSGGMSCHASRVTRHAAGPDEEGIPEKIRLAVEAGITWLLDLQNRDGGIPTFCRGWGALPFDRSGTDLTAHALRAWTAWLADLPPRLRRRTEAAIGRALAFLARAQRPDGSWVPLWFGNQFRPDEDNPTYGTARVLLALAEVDRLSETDPQGVDRLSETDPLPPRTGEPRSAGMIARGLEWLLANQNDDGGWGGGRPTPSSVEETSLAVEALAEVAASPPEASAGPPQGAADGSAGASPSQDASGVTRHALERGVAWLIERTDHGRSLPPAPIGFYFAKLWYSERLYPLVFALSALSRAARIVP